MVAVFVVSGINCHLLQHQSQEKVRTGELHRWTYTYLTSDSRIYRRRKSKKFTVFKYIIISKHLWITLMYKVNNVGSLFYDHPLLSCCGNEYSSSLSSMQTGDISYTSPCLPIRTELKWWEESKRIQRWKIRMVGG